MTLVVLAVVAALAAGRADPLDSRVAQANAAAQALQGPLDGAWTLRDRREREVYALRMTDPPNGPGAGVGAWRDIQGRLGALTFTRLGARAVAIDFGEGPVRFARGADGVWRGAARGLGRVTLTRSLASLRPPV